MGKRNPHIIIIDKHALFRDALKDFLLSKDISSNILLFDSLQQFMEDKDASPMPDLVIIDAMLLGKESTSLLREYLALNPQIRSIALSIFNGIPRFEELVALGFKGYVNKNQVYTQLAPAIETTLEGGYHFPFRS